MVTNTRVHELIVERNHCLSRQPRSCPDDPDPDKISDQDHSQLFTPVYPLPFSYLNGY